MLVEITDVGKGSAWFVDKHRVVGLIINTATLSYSNTNAEKFYRLSGKLMYVPETSNIRLPDIYLSAVTFKKVSQFYLARKLAKQLNSEAKIK